MRPICSVLVLLALSACSPGRPTDVQGSLQDLGVDTTATDPQGPGGETLAPDDAPLGGEATLDKVAEVALVAIQPMDSSDTFRVLDTDADGNVTTMTQGTPDWTTTAWHTATASDLDGDGREEVVGVALEDGALVVHWTEPSDSGWQESTWHLGPTSDLTGLSATGGDVTGDGVGDLVVAAGHPGSADLYVVAGSPDGLDLASHAILGAHREGAALDVRLATGRLDVDNARETALVVNEQDGVSWWQVRDDTGADFAVLHEGDVVAADPETGALASAVRADVALGDFDGDGLDEIALGGIANLLSSCGEESHTVLEVLDDEVRGLAVVGEARAHRQWRPCSSAAAWRVSTAMVRALDVDGDGLDEIALNDAIYDDLAAGPLAVTWSLPPKAVFPVGDTHGGWWDEAHVSMDTGDVDQDGREDLVLYDRNVRPTLTTWGIRGLGGQDGFGLIRSDDVSSLGSGDPQVVTANVDDDSVVVSYDAGTYEYVFTEPVILAVLSAPPCYAQQAKDGSCTTAWGRSTTTGTTEGYALRTEATATVGFKAGGEVFGVGLQAEGTLTVMRAASEQYERSYELTKTVTYSTGSMDDAVVFTTIPYDRYTYTILTNPDPELVGTQVVVSLPRKPITLIADRDYYNAHVVEGATQIDDNYLHHVAGDPTSYPTTAEKARWIGDGLESDLVTVGVGGGETAVDLDVSTAVSRGGSL